MPHGPVNSMTLDRINLPAALLRSLNMEDDWHTILTDRENNGVGLVNPNLSADDFDELSLADIEVLDRVWEQFGNMSEFDLNNWTHNPQNVPEWENPNGSVKPISLLSMMTAVGIENPEQQVEDVKESEEIDSFFERL